MLKLKISICLMVIVLISCRPTEPSTGQVNSTIISEITKEVVSEQVTEASTARVEATKGAEPTMEIVPTRQDVIKTPLPRYLGYVDPEPGKSYTIAEYNELVKLSTDTIDPSICFSIVPLWLMEPGDFPTMDQFLSWIYITVDDIRISQFSGLRTSNSLGAEGVNRFTNEIVWKAPDGSPYQLCYAAELSPGIHTATIFVEKSVEEQESFTWSFEITE